MPRARALPNREQPPVTTQLRRALAKKEGITPQGVSWRVQKLRNDHKDLLITPEDAVCVVAHQAGIRLDEYLDNDTLGRVRGVLQQLSPQSGGILPTQRRNAKSQQKGPERKEKVIVIGKEFRVTDPILPERIISEAKEMADVYPFLYILENSLREAIKRVMTARHGGNWWDTKAPQGLRETVKKRMQDEERNSWHQRRGAHPTDYLDLNQLPSLARQIQGDLVPDIIPSIEWFTQFVDEVYRSRCVVCHMNPLEKSNIQSVKLRFDQWQKQITAKRSLVAAPS